MKILIRLLKRVLSCLFSWELRVLVFPSRIRHQTGQCVVLDIYDGVSSLPSLLLCNQHCPWLYSAVQCC